jgi:hypothetical protein
MILQIFNDAILNVDVRVKLYGKTIINGELATIWKEVTVNYLTVLFQHLMKSVRKITKASRMTKI